MNKDWTGNKKTTFAQLGASNHSDVERESNDFYATDPESLEIFLKALDRDNIKLHNDIWECACGQGHLSKVLENKGYRVLSSDLIYRDYGSICIDFLKCKEKWDGDILTNPPYKYAKEFVEKALEITQPGAYVVMFLKIQFLEGKDRRKLFDKYPPKYVYVVEYDSYYEFYLQRYSYATIKLMVGFLKNKYSYESMLNMVKAELIDYMSQYNNDVGE